MPLEGIDWRNVSAIVAIVLSLLSQVYYVRGVLHGETKPHTYTWLIWTITLGTAAAGLLSGGANILTASGLIVGAVGVLLIFFLSFKYGTRNITNNDSLLLIAALAAVVVWWQLDQPILAVLMVSVIDAIGYIPTYRKSWSEPWSEDMPAWILVTLSYVFSVLSLDSYNLLTIPYLATITLANIILMILLLIRRQKIPKPS